MYREDVVDELIKTTSELEKAAREEIQKLTKLLSGTTISVQVDNKEVTQEILASVETLKNNSEGYVISNAEEFKDAIIAETGCSLKEFFIAIKEFSMRKQITSSETEGSVAILPLVFDYCNKNADAKSDLLQIINSKNQ